MQKVNKYTILIVIFLLFASLFVGTNITAYASDLGAKRELKIALDSVEINPNESVSDKASLLFLDGTSLMDGHYIDAKNVQYTPETGDLYLIPNESGYLLDILDQEGNLVSDRYQITQVSESNGRAHFFSYNCATICTLCDYRRERGTQIHVAFNDFRPYNNNSHFTGCICGEVVLTEPHFYKSENYVSIDGVYHKNTCVCGYVEYKSHPIKGNDDTPNCLVCGGKKSLVFSGKLCYQNNRLSALDYEEGREVDAYIFATDNEQLDLALFTFDNQIISEVRNLVKLDESGYYSLEVVGVDGSIEEISIYANKINHKVCIAPKEEDKSKITLDTKEIVAIAVSCLVVVVIVSIIVVVRKNATF